LNTSPERCKNFLRKIEHKSGKKQNILRKLECRGWQFTLHGRFVSLDAKQSIIAKVKFGGTHLHTDISMDIDELASLRIQPRNGFTATLHSAPECPHLGKSWAGMNDVMG
jgi:hypothetical protein